MPHRPPATRLRRRATIGLVLGSTLCLAGCARIEVVHLAPLSWTLDANSERHLSSYPSWFPQETAHVPFLYKTVRTPDTVFLQLSARAVRTQSGPDPQIGAITIRSLSYRPANGDAVRLLTDHKGHFWMQGDDIPGARKSSPIRCSEGESITVTATLTLNDVDYQREGVTRCAVRTRTVPLLLHAMAS